MNSVRIWEPGQDFRPRPVFDMDESVPVRLARIESDVEHMKSDVSDIRSQLIRTDQKIEEVRKDLTGRIEGLRTELTGKIDGLRQDLASMKVWAIGLYVALAGTLLAVMAKGFKWL